VEPGELELRFGASSADIRACVPVRLVGPEREVDHHRCLTASVAVHALDAAGPAAQAADGVQAADGQPSPEAVS
jgi:hypothetical protein